jgi:hypothetical protein
MMIEMMIEISRYGHRFRRDEVLTADNSMRRRDQKMWDGRHCRDGEGSKAEMIWH